ncbi:glycerol-3-phosphate acyltransferase 3-like, partial [Melanerpes formicivorus]|uniref:glycerol-3-phosphate acyltransferase 3-like n=1 Tax=Melanerpes formicivorus TaxID=211600 RepID=UPI00358EE348
MGLLAKHSLSLPCPCRLRALSLPRIQEHIADKAKLPILIFPEGTCINNTSVMMFKKGSFEYDPRFADPFWDSTKRSMLSYSLHMLTSWAVVCHVWYLPPHAQR